MNRNGLLCTLALLTITISTQAQNTTSYWSLAGNSNATAASKLGTTNSTPLRLLTNNVERLRIDPLGKVGIGTTSPTGKLTLFNNGSVPAGSWVTAASPLFVGYGETAGGNADFFLAMASNTRTTRPNIISRRARGTLAAPLAVVENDFITSFQASGYDGSAFQNPANIDFFVDGTPSAGNVPVRISLTTGSNLSNRVERVKIGSTGNIAFNTNQMYLDKASGNIGIGTTAPAARLDVLGDIASGTGINVKGNVYGIYSSSDGIGVYSTSVGTGATFGTYAVSGYIGTYGYGDTYGTMGSTSSGTGANGNSITGDGVTGFSEESNGGYFTSTNGYGIRASTMNASYAGVFDGNVYASNVYTTSDRNLKQNLKEFTDAMSIINKLKPQKYEFKTEAKYVSLHLPKGSHYGLMAQDLEEVLPSLVSEGPHEVRSSKSLAAIRPDANRRPVPVVVQVMEEKEIISIKAVNYTEFIPIIIKGMQELNQKTEEIDGLKEENQQLKEEMAELRKMMLELKTGRTSTVTYNAAYLEQNSPNPVSGSTIIRYHVPETATSARLVISNAKGQAVRTITISNRGAGQVTFNSMSLAAGTYNYTLYVDGKQADTKRLVIVR